MIKKLIRFYKIKKFQRSNKNLKSDIKYVSIPLTDKYGFFSKH